MKWQILKRLCLCESFLKGVRNGAGGKKEIENFAEDSMHER